MVVWSDESKTKSKLGCSTFDESTTFKSAFLLLVKKFLN